ncbi:MAG: alanine dehydrogenase [Bacteroidetes bacterium GWF2_43_63]|nr:MAG: alanine dehydrogenase [Bacteroidetes bacterium GWE2_42_42]OFY54146.1 MAG: alanine dehydrogenase [Bacteroidetes bacterium GWF2_43_63]HBG70817.1 alanine dehydrogenase [Bacteroidales bacterium]HCB61721.1 alanine dehydrogenase [Bacteroidales bacterium]HCY22097.1 alanine dehydrogenase [Bacteroidales bacterium]
MTENNIYNMGPAGQMMPAEERLEIKRKKSSLKIGVPLEIAFQENRVSLAPDSVGLIVSHGHEVYVQRGAGRNAHFSDEEYAEAGATLTDSAAEIYQCNLILKVAPMLPSEIDMLQSRQTVVSALHSTMQTAEYFKKLMQHKTTAVAFEFIKDQGNIFPVLKAMSEISGYAAIQVAAEYLSKNDIGKGKLLGGIPGIAPVEVVILGAGTVGTYAARAALGFGAEVKVFDNHIYKLRSLQQDIGKQIFTSIIHPKVLSKSLKNADIVIGALHSIRNKPMVVVTEEMVADMKPGSVIVDVSIDQGGCIETSAVTTHKDPVFIKHDVIHYCVPNIPSRVPQTASYGLSNFFTPVIMEMGEEGGIEAFLKANPSLRQGIYMFNGILTNHMIGQNFGLPSKELDLLLASFQM